MRANLPVSLLKKILVYITGSPDVYSLEHRIFNGLSMLLSILTLIGNLSSAMLQLDFTVIQLGFVGSLVCFIFYIFSRFAGFYNKISTLGLFISGTVVLSFMWFYNGGNQSQVDFLLVMFFVGLLMVGKEVDKWVLVICLTGFITLYTLEYLHPEWVTPYADRFTMYVDNLIAIIWSLLLTFYSIYFFKKRYFEDRKLLLHQNSLMEEQRALMEAKNIDLEKKNEQIENLLRELNHRVMNNLQMISSLINLQIRMNKSNSAEEVLRQTNNRIMAIAMLHQKIYSKDTGGIIYLPDYIKQLIENIVNIYGFNNDNCTLNINIDKEFLPMEQVTPLGILINELVTNSMKHGMKQDEKNSLTLQLNIIDNICTLVYADSGSGYDFFHPDNGDTLGIVLINSTVEQLGGKIVQPNAQTLRITFKTKTATNFEH